PRRACNDPDNGCMQSSLLTLAIVGVIGLAAGIGLGTRRVNQARLGALRDWGLRNEGAVGGQAAGGWGVRIRGDERHGVSLVVRGMVKGRPVAIAEYAYTTTSTTAGGGAIAPRTTTTTHEYVLTVVRLSRAYPSIGVYHRGALSKLGRVLFGDE